MSDRDYTIERDATGAAVRLFTTRREPARAPYIVMLEAGVYLADTDGDPGRTLKRENAQRFTIWFDAYEALVLARRFRRFKDAQILGEPSLARTEAAT